MKNANHLSLTPHNADVGRLASLVAAGWLVLWASAGWAGIDYTDNQRETIVEMVEQLENRHYAKLEYDDSLSSEHLDNYIESLDGGKMFFLASDVS